MPRNQKSPDRIAAIDLGSNSFHLVVACFVGNELRVLERRSEKIQLAAGLDEQQHLNREVQKRALECLREYARRLRDLPPESVRVVGTNALRQAKNSAQFVARASQILGHPIDIIAGREEARLIYLGVSHTLADDHGKRLVVDIGGGSTELIIGERFEPRLMESMHMGCIGYAQRFFANDLLRDKQFDAAVTAAQQELQPVRNRFRHSNWKHAVGSSGTVKAILNVANACHLVDDVITRDALYELRRRALKAKHVVDLKLPGLETQRQGIFVPGLAILTAVFESLDIDEMQYSVGALREGSLYDLVGRNSHEDVRDRSIRALMERNHVDVAHAEQVAKTALKLFAQVCKAWNLQDPDADLLRRAALAHEIGLDISHSNFQKHGAYLLQHSDLAGFPRQEQKILAALVRNHRRKLSLDSLLDFDPELRQRTLHTALLLRLAVILHHDRNGKKLAVPTLRTRNACLQLNVPAQWATSRPLVLADLQQEAGYLAKIGYRLDLRVD